MGKLVAVSPVGKNGQTVVPAVIRKMFGLGAGSNLVGFYIEGQHVEIAPVSIEKEEISYTMQELDKMEVLAKEKGGKKYKTATSAKRALKKL